MSLPDYVITRRATILTDLARQMTELVELRKAVRLQVALRSRSDKTRGSGPARRPPVRSSFPRDVVSPDSSATLVPTFLGS